MNIIYIKQAVKAKVNKRDTYKAIKSILHKILGCKENEVKSVIINTSDIKDVTAGSSIILASNGNDTKFVAVSCGASNKDILCTTDFAETGNYMFEYAMLIDKKIFNSMTIEDVAENINNVDSKDMNEALAIIGTIATNARYQSLVSGNFGVINEEKAKDSRYQGIVVVDFKESDRETDLETEVIGRRGKLHIMQVVPLLESEINGLRYFDDPAMSEITALGMIKDSKGLYSNRQKQFNFANVMPVSKMNEETIKELGLAVDKENKPIILTDKDIDKVINKMF